jgi:hypothetical protein
MDTKHERKRRASPTGPGFTIRQFAERPRIKSTPAVIRGAVKRGDVKAIAFNGVLRIPPSEEDRLVALWGEPASAE